MINHYNLHVHNHVHRTYLTDVIREKAVCTGHGSQPLKVKGTVLGAIGTAPDLIKGLLNILVPPHYEV